MSLLPWKRPDRGRMFEVECECGEIFKVPFNPEEVAYDRDRDLLVPLEGSCPWCGLRLEQIQPPAPSGRAARSRA